MKFKKIYIFLVFFQSFELFASAPIYVGYKSDTIEINQFLCFSSEFDKDIIPNQSDVYSNLEEKFIKFCQFTDFINNISAIIKTKVSFYSQIDGSSLAIAGKNYYFAPTFQKQNENFNGYYFTDEYNDFSFMIKFICELYELKIQDYTKPNNNLFTLEFNSDINIELDEYNDLDLLFFYPGVEKYYSPFFRIKDKYCLGFYYTNENAQKMKNLIENKYSEKCSVVKLPFDWNLINQAYFKLDK